MFTLIIFETVNSDADIRENQTMVQAYTMAKNGGYYKAQIVNEFGVIEYEF